MKTYYFEKTSELKKAKKELEERLEVKIEIKGEKVELEGEPLEEYEASLVFDALCFGFSPRKALSLLDENNVFRVINMKDFTRKKNLKEVRGRVIGKHGKTKKTIEDISGADVIIKDNEIGLIAKAENIEEVITGLSNLVKGTKQSNTYRYLERMNKRKND